LGERWEIDGAVNHVIRGPHLVSSIRRHRHRGQVTPRRVGFITFLHELYHLLCSKDGINVSKFGEEKVVDKLSESFVRLLVHNPKLLDVFKKLLK